MNPQSQGPASAGPSGILEIRNDREASRTVAEVVDRHTQPVEQREIDQARNTIETQTIGRLENLNGVANMLNEYNHYLKTPDYLQKDIERIRAVTPASLMAFARAGAEIASIPMDADGLDVAAFEERLAGGLRPKVLYVIPEFQRG